MEEDIGEFEVTYGLFPRDRRAGDAQATVLVYIRSGTDAPANIYSAVPYKNHWYGIDDTDFASKCVFTSLLILFSLDETGQTLTTLIVTAPSR